MFSARVKPGALLRERAIRDAHRRARDGVVTVGTVTGLVAGLGLTLFGLGAPDHAMAGYDSAAWVWSSAKSEVARVNGLTGRVDTRYQIPDATGHAMQLTQTDRYLVLRDENTGLVSALDLATLRIAATTPTTAGLGVRIALHEESLFVVDAVQGIVRQLDPLALTPLGEPLRFPPGIGGGALDGEGLLWLTVPTEGTVVAVRPGRYQGPGPREGQPAGPRVDRTVPVAEPNHDLVLSALDRGVAVLDRTTTTLTVLRGEDIRRVVLDLAGPGAMPARTTGPEVPVTVAETRHLHVVAPASPGGPARDRVYDFRVPGTGPTLRPCVAWSGRFYCPDEATGEVHALSRTGELLATITVKGGAGPLDLEVRERHLFINAPHSSTAHVVDEHHRARPVDKYANQILGGEVPPPPAKPSRTPSVGRPGAPRNVTASAGDASARVTWGPAPANGSAILRYVIEGGPKPLTVGGNQRSAEVTGLVNGRTYRFTVHAVNAHGAGPKRASNPVVPTADVPDPPAHVTATANPDGTVTVTWPAANGQGRPIARYSVTAISADGAAEIGSVSDTTFTSEAGTLDYGTQYAFTVVAVNDKGAGSQPSPPSNTVVPFTRPGAVRQLVASSVDKPGTVRATWLAAADNGRPITGYVVSAGGREQTVTATSVELTGFGDGQTVTVSVKAVNAAGAGPAATASARTIAPPTVTITSRSGATNSITVGLAVNDNGSPTSCRISVGGSAPVSIGCGGGTVGGVWPGNTYPVTVTVTNAAGSATASDTVTTPALFGTVLCNDPGECGLNSPGGGVWVYSEPTQNPPPGRAVGDTSSPSRYQAICRTTDIDGVFIDARPWGGKRDNRWVRIRFSGENYIPFAWFRLDGGDDINQLPPC